MAELIQTLASLMGVAAGFAFLVGIRIGQGL